MNSQQNTIHVWDHTGKAPKLAQRCKRVLKTCMTHLKLREHEIHLTLITDATMKRLHHKHLQKNRATDVLSFPQNVRLPSGVIHLGDIMIATPTARRQARETRRTAENEFGLLTIHGLLHLLGYDHQSKKEARKMFDLQSRLCRKVHVREHI